MIVANDGSARPTIKRGTMMAENPTSPVGGATDLSNAFGEDQLDV
jgi:hypothetical protein